VKVPLTRSRRGLHSSSTRKEAPVAGAYVAIYLHQRRSVIYLMDEQEGQSTASESTGTLMTD
jgi:hypothetical protein